MANDFMMRNFPATRERFGVIQKKNVFHSGEGRAFF